MPVASYGDERRKEVTDINRQKKLGDRERRQLQHEFKLHMERYFKEKLGKGADYYKIVIFDDMLVIRGERFLTEPESFIVHTLAGQDVVAAARMHIAEKHAIDNIPYFEERLHAKSIHQSMALEAENDFWMHVIVFDRVLTE